jgi:hypothetical protein
MISRTQIPDEGTAFSMNKLTVSLENCYGIRKLQHVFDFSRNNVYALYAPNGSMKTSLALTFEALSDNRKPEDRRYHRTTICNIVDENGNALPGDSIVVLTPYEDPLVEMGNTQILLVSSKLREQWLRLNAETDNAKKTLLKALKTQSGIKASEVEEEFSITFTGAATAEDFYTALDRLQKELRQQTDTPYSDVPYDVVFNTKVLEALNEPDVKSALDAYIAKYNELISNSVYFRKGTFEYYNASSIAKHLADQGFFKAKHFVTLDGQTRKEITSREELEKFISEEKERIKADGELKAKFKNIDKLLTANQAMKDFRAYILDNEAVLSKMSPITKFKQEVWKSYLKSNMALYENVVEKRDEANKRNGEIVEAARAEQTQWERVIDTFNERFFVPCKVRIENRDAAVIGTADPFMAFTCEDGGSVASPDRKQLLEMLSQGERKALYILDILFDVQVRRQQSQETLFVIDDIADSFDYRNKYAIIEYLLDMAKEPKFKILVLTHNFDFFRTICRRVVPYDKCLMATKSPHQEIVLEQAEGIQNVFANDWKKKFFSDAKKRIASIPFMRNLIEYTRGVDDPEYAKLTSLVHWMPNTETIIESELDATYKQLFSGNGAAWGKPKQTVVASIIEEAEKCLNIDAGVNFEHKIVLSIAIRLIAEQYMIEKINDAVFVEGIKAHQTHALIDRFENVCGDNPAAIKVLHKVALVTPSNIHLNAFMYEPIIDMSDEHLKELYRSVKKLQKV